MTSTEVGEPIADVAAFTGADERRRGIADLRHHVARGTLINGAFQIGLVAISALRGLVVAVFLSRYDYGVWGLIGLTLWTALGLKNIFGAGEKYVQQSEHDQERAFQRAFTVELIFTAAATPIAAGVVVAFALLTGNRDVLVPGLILLLLLPSTALQFPLSAFYRQMNYRRQRALQAIEPVGGAIVMITLAALGAGYWSFVVGAIAGSWTGAIVALRASPYRLTLRYDRGTLFNYVGFSAPLLLTGVAVLAVFQVIFLVGAGPLGLAGLGAFTLVGNLVQFTDQADSIVTGTLYPAVCAVQDRIGLLSEIFVKSNRLSLMWAVPFGVGMSLFGSDLVRFMLGTRWQPAVPLLEIMGIVTAANHVGYNWSAFVKARGTTWPIALTGVVVAATVIGAGIPLMYSEGLRGLGYAFAIGTLVGLVLRGFVLARFFHGIKMMSHLLRAFAPTLVAAAPVIAVRILAGREQTLVGAIAVFTLYAGLTVLATLVFERPLLREALGYLLPRREGAISVGAGAAS
jgi:O-antigen/teichoic acid export membrane protein